MRRNPADGACPHINPNAGGVRNGGWFWIFENWFGFFGKFWNRNAQTEQRSDPSIVRIMQNQAIKLNSSQNFLYQIDIYLLVDEKNRIKTKGSKSLEIFK